MGFSTNHPAMGVPCMETTMWDGMGMDGLEDGSMEFQDSEDQAAADCGCCMILHGFAWFCGSWDVRPRLISERTALEDASKAPFESL